MRHSLVKKAAFNRLLPPRHTFGPNMVELLLRKADATAQFKGSLRSTGLLQRYNRVHREKKILAIALLLNPTYPTDDCYDYYDYQET